LRETWREEAVRVELEALDHVGLVVSDMARSVRWYSEVLGLRRAHEAAWGDFPAVLAARGIGFHEGDFGVAWSVYLPDPDGYQVEITTYEPA
jgi:catechol 2,3-dioxygenase-like lactoylglutathione lyase family enzyme